MKTDAGERSSKKHKYHSRNMFQNFEQEEMDRKEKLMPLQIRFLFYEHCLMQEKELLLYEKSA